MQTVDELHHLVHSLTPAEKRAFTTHAKRHVKNPQYLRLFTTLDALSVYHADAVRKVFRGSAAEHNLTELRYALLEEIVACLDRLQAASDVVSRLQREAEAVAFLAERGCYATAERRLKRARAAAIAHELPALLLDFCVVRRQTFPQTRSSQKTLMEDERYALELAQDQHDAARELESWIRRATSMERFNVSAEDKSLSTNDGSMVAEARVAATAAPPSQPLHASSLGTLRRLHASLLRASCLRDADAFMAQAHALANLLNEHSKQLMAYTSDVNGAIVDLVDEAALLRIEDRLEELTLPAGRPHEHMLRHRVATLMRTALSAYEGGDVNEAMRITALVLGDGVLSQAHEGWTAQATVLTVRLHQLAGRNRMLKHIVRNALRTEERRRRFTPDEIAVLKQSIVSASRSRSARSSNKTVLRVRRY